MNNLLCMAANICNRYVAVYTNPLCSIYQWNTYITDNIVLPIHTSQIILFSLYIHTVCAHNTHQNIIDNGLVWQLLWYGLVSIFTVALGCCPVYTYTLTCVFWLRVGWGYAYQLQGYRVTPSFNAKNWRYTHNSGTRFSYFVWFFQFFT